MQKFNYFVGIDISKKTLDFLVVQSDQQLFHLKTNNDEKSIGCFMDQLKQLPHYQISQVLFCMKYTGLYNHFILQALTTLQACISIQAAIQIKYSSGLQRGKNDKIDAKRIALYAYQKKETITLWQPKGEVMNKLTTLVALRNRLIKAKNGLKMALSETTAFSQKTIVKGLSLLCKSSMQALEADLKKATKAIDQVIKSDEGLNHLFTLITSVKGIGQITATEIILASNEFKDIKEGKKFAAYGRCSPL